MKASTEQRELQRLTLQAELDAKKSKDERNRLGQFATPPTLAQEVVAYGLELLPESTAVRFLDPAFGTGSFYSALLGMIPSARLVSARGIEIDPHYGEPAKMLWNQKSLQLEIDDFTQMESPKEKANLIVCNPPYVRHHHLGAEEKRRLQNACMRASGMALSGLSGLYCYFLGLSHQWMEQNGIAAWLIPSEFMDVNYGDSVKRYLLDEVTLLRIHRFDPKSVQFSDALVSSAVVWFRNSPPPKNHLVEFTFGGSHAMPAISKRIPRNELRVEGKWTRFPTQPSRNGSKGVTLSHLFDIKRGIATGSNDFFILSPGKISELGLPREFFRPILPSPRYLADNEIRADAEGNPVIAKPLFLLDCRLPEETVRTRFPNLWAYLEQGKEEMTRRYLCKTRSPWYSQEHREPTPFVCTYMGRGTKDSATPFRFILNHSRAIVANSYLMIYPKPFVQERLRSDPSLIRAVWQALRDIGRAALIDEGRVYGGGLHKMEPKELASVSAANFHTILRVPSQTEIFAT